MQYVQLLQPARTTVCVLKYAALCGTRVVNKQSRIV